MRGELLPVWAETWREVWSKLAKHPDAPEDLFSELYRACVTAPIPPVEPVLSGETNQDGALIRPEDINARAAYNAALSAFAKARARYEEAVGNEGKARTAFKRQLPALAPSEPEAVSILEKAFRVIDDFDVEALRNRYFTLVEGFLVKFSLRYDLRRPFTLHPTLPGVFARMMSQLKDITRTDAHLHSLMGDFEDALRDLRNDQSQTRIKTCIQKQVNLIEAISRMYPAVTEQTLGRICDQLGQAPNVVFPHDKVRDAVKNIYSFASDYPGIRHGGTPVNARRDIEMRDMVAISILLAGFTPYISHQVNSSTIYRG